MYGRYLASDGSIMISRHWKNSTYWVPAKAKKRKEIVPTNSPITATVWPRVVGGRVRRSRRTGPSTGAVVGASVFMMVYGSTRE